ncbi:MAG: hypothetical protein EBS53_06820 [Bacteroidetes bacterium]|nr:hypothetical protein [Bacteroidota bacterium]
MCFQSLSGKPVNFQKSVLVHRLKLCFKFGRKGLEDLCAVKIFRPPFSEEDLRPHGGLHPLKPIVFAEPLKHGAALNRVSF